MLEKFAIPALSTIPVLVIKYGVLWLLLYVVRYFTILLVRAQRDSHTCDYELTSSDRPSYCLRQSFLTQIVNPWRSYLRYLPGPPGGGMLALDQMLNLQK